MSVLIVFICFKWMVVGVIDVSIVFSFFKRGYLTFKGLVGFFFFYKIMFYKFTAEASLFVEVNVRG